MCVSHGGAAPQVKERANQRLLALVEPAITALERIIRSGDSDGVKLAACRDVLDRAGFRAAVKLEAEQTMQVTVRYEEQPILHVPTRQNGHSHAVP